MPQPPLSESKRAQIVELLAHGKKTEAIARAVGVAAGTVSKVKHAHDFAQEAAELQQQAPLRSPGLDGDKKIGTFDWREWAQWAQAGQELKRKASWSQEKASFPLGDGTKPVILATFSDQQIGDWGTDYGLFVKITEEIRDTPNLYMAMLGDESQHAIKLRSVLEVASGSLIPPEQQEMFIESWINEIKHKIAFGTWSNHSVERSEKQAGSSVIKNLVSRSAVYFNGIGHAEVTVGSQTYSIAASHVFQGKSIYSSTHGPRRYVRHEAPDRDIVMQGDLHRPELMVYFEGGKKHIAITCGSIQNNSGYAKRYFSLLTIPAYPCVVLDNKEHKMTPFWTIREAVDHLSRFA